MRQMSLRFPACLTNCQLQIIAFCLAHLQLSSWTAFASQFQQSSCPMASALEWLLPLLQDIQGTSHQLEEQMVGIQEDCLDVFACGSFTVVKFRASIFITL